MKMEELRERADGYREENKNLKERIVEVEDECKQMRKAHK